MSQWSPTPEGNGPMPFDILRNLIGAEGFHCNSVYIYLQRASQ